MYFVGEADKTVDLRRRQLLVNTIMYVNRGRQNDAQGLVGRDGDSQHHLADGAR